MRNKQLLDLDYSKIADIEIDGIDHRDYPDYCDAFITYASYGDRELTQEELDLLNDDSQFVYECVIKRIF